MKALIFSDIQFYNNPSKSIVLANGRYSWFDQQMQTAEKIFKIAGDRSISKIIHNGDLFEEKTRINVGLYNDVWKFFAEKAKEGFKIILNTGNHDMLSTQESSLTPFSEICTVITEPTGMAFDKVYFRFLPYGQTSNNLKLPTGNEFHILFTHETISGLTLGPCDYELATPFKQQLFGDWDIVFNGHIHKPQNHKNIINIGSPVIQSFGEMGEKKRIIILEDDKPESVELDGPEFIELSRLTEKLKKKIAKDSYNFYRIDISSDQLKDPIFDKHNVFSKVVKTKTREIRLKKTNGIKDEIGKYVKTSKTELDKDKLIKLGYGFHQKVKEGN